MIERFIWRFSISPGRLSKFEPRFLSLCPRPATGPQLPSDRKTKGCLRNLKSCLGELGLLGKKTQTHRGIRNVVFKSSKNCCRDIVTSY